MNSQHLSDEAIAAFADGVLRGHARERAARHSESCAECRQAVRSQREAVLALRSAPAPSLPAGMFERLQAVAATTPVPSLPTILADDGTTLLRTSFAPMAAFVPAAAPTRPALRSNPFFTGAAVLALTAGALAAGGVLTSDATPTHGVDTITTRMDGTGHAPVEPQFVGARFARR